MNVALFLSPWLVGVLVAVFGAYLGALADRFSYWFHVSKALLWKKYCPGCFTLQRWLTYVPILGYIFRRGVCINCKKALPVIPHIAETGAAATLTFIWYFSFYGQLPTTVGEIGRFLLIAAAVWGATVLGVSDLVYDEVPMPAYLATFLAITLNIFIFSGWDSLVVALATGLLGGIVMSILMYATAGKWVHAHDVLFAIIVGMIVGWPAFFVTLAVAYLFAVMGGLVSWGWNTRLWKGTSSFGIYLFVALFVQGACTVIAGLITL